ncbi:probable cyclic nucleotide-gated ion channel 10 [Humulus lupulus]|uniref:probable cyclic nucleotide-gated ion channel 10 n=1 Tax=Humulus lupulus TaxID=3486 RepID=UPI002B410DDD|nr:probable cyclic nucleotide-gated ion channel 10 [Humulus lupulus]
MILPRKVIDGIEAICRAYLWKGQHLFQGAGLIAWERVCQSKAAGGIGFKRVAEWNISAIIKYVWAIANNEENLWVKWIHSVYLKGGDWWNYQPLTQGSWYWKKLVAVKDRVKNITDIQGDHVYENNCDPTREEQLPHQNETPTAVENILNPWTAYPRVWHKIFLVSCLIGVSIDPLFLYIPIVNDNKKCLDIDNNIKNIFLALRCVTDFSYVLHIIFRLQIALSMSKELGQSIFTGFPWSYLLIDVLAILPLPQVVVLVYFPEITGSKSLLARKFLGLLLLLQYVPRILRVYLSAKELGRTYDSLTQRVWVRGAFFFSLYIISGHVFGAFWYFYSTFRETACWHNFCKALGSQECVPGPFDCRGNHFIKNLTKLDQYCPINPPNSAIFDFGIFSHAIESRIVSQTDFLRKFSSSFWWGLKNLSSFGQNLDTSSNVQENIFAVLISILGLLLFLYLIGTLQTYMQLETTKSEEARIKISIKQPEIDSYLSTHDQLPPQKKKIIKRYLTRKIREGKDFDVRHLFSLLEEHSDHGLHKSETFSAWVNKILDVNKHEKKAIEQANSWISKNGIPNDIKPKILKYVQLRLQEGKDVDIEHVLDILPSKLGMSIKKHMCFPVLRKVPLFQNMDDYVYESICNSLKPVIYSEKSYIIRKGEPLDMVLLITQGVVWSFGTSSMVRLQRGDYYGNELVEWQLNSTSYNDFPISTANVKSHTKVEAFALMAIDLEHVLSSCWVKFFQYNSTNETMSSEGLKSFAATSVQRGFRRYIKLKKAQENKLSIHVNP